MSWHTWHVVMTCPVCVAGLHIVVLVQVVVLAGGTNDFHVLPPPALEDWLPSYMDLINTVSSSLHEILHPC